MKLTLKQKTEKLLLKRGISQASTDEMMNETFEKATKSFWGNRTASEVIDTMYAIHRVDGVER